MASRRTASAMSLAAATLLGAALSAAPGDAHEADAVTVRDLLTQGYERAPSRAEVAEHVDDVDAALIAVYRDPQSAMLERMRALDLLKGHPSDALHALIASEIERDDLDVALRRRLLATAVETYGEPDPELCRRALESALASPQPVLRYSAANTLSRIPDAETVDTLGRAALERETDPHIRATLERTIESRLDEAPR